MKVEFKKFNENAVIPTAATGGSGGWDVTVTEIEKVDDDFVICKLGFGLKIPFGYKVMIVPRSSLTKYAWVIPNSPGLIDSDYRDEIQVRFRAIPNSAQKMFGTQISYPGFPYKVGDRIAQMYLQEVIQMDFLEVEELDKTTRDGGFGSTGK